MSAEAAITAWNRRPESAPTPLQISGPHAGKLMDNPFVVPYVPNVDMVAAGESAASIGIGKPVDEEAITRVWCAMLEAAPLVTVERREESAQVAALEARVRELEEALAQVSWAAKELDRRNRIRMFDAYISEADGLLEGLTFGKGLRGKFALSTPSAPAETKSDGSASNERTLQGRCDGAESAGPSDTLPEGENQ